MTNGNLSNNYKEKQGQVARPDTDHTATSQSLPFTPHTTDSAKVVDALHSDPDRGLSENDASNRLQVYGPNRLKPPRRPKLWNIVLRQVGNAMTVVLGELSMKQERILG